MKQFWICGALLVLTGSASAETLPGWLTPADPIMEDYSHYDEYTVTVQRGEEIRVSMRSGDFDPFLQIRDPDGSIEKNDDCIPSSRHACLVHVVRSSGTLSILANSYQGWETGAYVLEFVGQGELVVGALPEGQSAEAPGELFGLFVGISNYAPADKFDPEDPNSSDLNYTADDAKNLHDGLRAAGQLKGNNGVLLLDEDATVASFRGALRRMSERIGPDDRFILFFSGHGDEERGDREFPDRDGTDETLVLFDGSILDNDLADILSEFQSRITLVLLDSCFSGGFSKDLSQKVETFVGLFTCQEGVTALVADKFRAGGYLSRFITEALIEWRADDNQDGIITIWEMHEYVQQRFNGVSRRRMKSSQWATAAESIHPETTDGVDLINQHLVFEREAVNPNAVMLAR